MSRSIVWTCNGCNDRIEEWTAGGGPAGASVAFSSDEAELQRRELPPRRAHNPAASVRIAPPWLSNPPVPPSCA
jgi:hypothetical protein